MDVPIKFTYRGEIYEGEFSSVHGAGRGYGDDWHLMINNYYQGHLFYSQHFQHFVFKSQTGKFEDISDYFEAYLVGWFA